MELEFEWDSAKRKSNLRDHGVDFLDVWKMFNGPMVERIDDREDYGEERIVAVGEIGLRLLLVVFTRRGSKIRIISARKANRHDKEEYYREIYGQGT